LGLWRFFECFEKNRGRRNSQKTISGGAVLIKNLQCDLTNSATTKMQNADQKKAPGVGAQETRKHMKKIYACG